MDEKETAAKLFEMLLKLKIYDQNNCQQKNKGKFRDHALFVMISRD